MKLLSLFLLGFGMPAMSQAAAIVEKTVAYQDQGKTFEGFMAMPSKVNGSAPGVLVIHNWLGVTDETKSKVRALAELGYVAFAADVYGKGIRPQSMEEAGKLAGQYKKNRVLLREHLNLALNQLTLVKGVDAKRLAVIGYCFGGTSAIELARSGANLKAVVSFHGGLDSPEPALGKNIKGKVIAFHGADDPWVPGADVAAFEEEMRSHKIDWQLVKFGNAVHSFTDKSAGSDPSKGAAYNAFADQRSWQMMKDFFKEVL